MEQINRCKSHGCDDGHEGDGIGQAEILPPYESENVRKGSHAPGVARNNGRIEPEADGDDQDNTDRNGIDWKKHEGEDDRSHNRDLAKQDKYQLNRQEQGDVCNKNRKE